MTAPPGTSDSERDRLLQRITELESQLAATTTARDAAQAKLDRHDEQWAVYLELFHSIPVGIVYVDRESIVRLCNRAAAGFIGRQLDEIINSHLHDIFPTNAEAWSLVERALDSAEGIPVQQFRMPGNHPGSWPRDYLIAFLLDRAPDGTTRGVYVTSQEVTELLQTQDALTFLTDASTQLGGSIDYDETLQTAVDLAVPRLADLCMIDIVAGDVGRVVARAVDPERERLLYEVRQHYPFDPNANAPWTRLVREQGPILAPEADGGQVATLARDEGHAEYLRRIAARSTLFLPLMADGEMIGILSLGMAESGRRFGPAEQRLAAELARRVATSIVNATIYRDAQSAEARYRGLFEGAADAIVVVDNEGTYIDVNPAMSALTGYSRDELLTIRAGDGQLTANGDGSKPQFDEIRRAGAFRGEMELRRKDGSVVPVESVIRSVALPDGTVFINMMRDISRRRELERLQRDFMAIVSHELKGPLTSIKGFGQIMLRQGTFSERAVDSILLQAGQIERLINDMFHAAQSDTDRLELWRNEVNLIEIADTAVDQARATSASHTIRLDTASPEIIGEWDRERLVQVFSNLLSNAIKYSPEGGEIVVSIRQSEHDAQVSISDQGIGIPAAAMPRLFERFYRVEEAGRTIKGLGLGLYITRSLIEAHGGRITVSSEANRGTTFTFTLPCYSNA